MNIGKGNYSVRQKVINYSRESKLNFDQRRQFVVRGDFLDEVGEC